MAISGLVVPNPNFHPPFGPGSDNLVDLPVTTDMPTLLAAMEGNALASPEFYGRDITLRYGDITPGTGASLTDADGNVYTLPYRGGLWGNSMGQLKVNGVGVDDASGWVDAMRNINGTVYFENAKGAGWYTVADVIGDDPGPGNSTSTPPPATPDTIAANTVLQAPSVSFLHSGGDVSQQPEATPVSVQHGVKIHHVGVSDFKLPGDHGVHSTLHGTRSSVIPDTKPIAAMVFAHETQAHAPHHLFAHHGG